MYIINMWNHVKYQAHTSHNWFLWSEYLIYSTRPGRTLNFLALGNNTKYNDMAKKIWDDVAETKEGVFFRHIPTEKPAAVQDRYDTANTHTVYAVIQFF